MNSQKNSYDDIDNMLFKHFNENKEIPEDIENLIKSTTFPKKKKGYKNIIRKIAITIVAISTLTGGMVFANDIATFFKELFGLNTININNDEVTNAISNKDYIQNVDMEYLKLNEEYNIKVDYLMIDDINMYIIFNIKSNQEIAKNYRISITDLTLSDEQGNTIYDANNQNDNQKFMVTTGWKKIEQLNNNKRELFFLMSNEIPNIKKLNFKFTNIVLYNESNPSIGEITINGNYSFYIDIIDKFLNRETYQFVPEKNSNSKDYVVEKCIITETGTYLLYKTVNPSIELEIKEPILKGEKTLLGIGYDNYYYFIIQYSLSKENASKFEQLIFKDSYGEEIILKK